MIKLTDANIIMKVKNMISNLRQKLKDKQIEYILRSSEYNEFLKETVKNITNECKKTINEASTVSCFEIELYSFIRETLGIKYYPTKEEKVNAIRHTAKGIMDSKIGCIVTEFKHYSKLRTEAQIEDATEQIKEYIQGLYKTFNTDYLGVLTDGVRIRFIRLERGTFQIEQIKPIEVDDINRIIKTILLLDKIALTSANLVKDFALTEGSISKKLSMSLFNVLNTKISDKTSLLFSEWKELFKLSHDDKSKQLAIELRRKELEIAMSQNFGEDVDMEYKAMFSLQTTYAIITKIIAFKVISKIYFNKSLISFEKLAIASYDELMARMQQLEEGEIFRNIGVLNLLEGDFFSWYCWNLQWNRDIAKCIQDIYQVLSKYEDIAIFNNGKEVQDLFKDLYLEIMPDKVRHSLGEYYTAPWLADSVLETALKYVDKHNWKGLDPCAGSGTFITRMIAKILQESDINDKEGKKQALHSILNRVKAIDLNPLAVLTARINYFINISHLVDEEDKFEIPVYLGDASYVPEVIEVDGIKCLSYKIKTLKGDIDINLPKSMLSSISKFSEVMDLIEFDVKMKDTDAIISKIESLIPLSEQNSEIMNYVSSLAQKLVELEQKHWNGIWVRIIKNYLITSVIGDFDIIIGNPPWVDWKNLPSTYRERIKTSVCIDNSLFSGASRTGGINLNICALISNVSASKWLSKKGILAFLMPKTIIHQSSYEGFRAFKLSNGNRLYLQEILDWNEAGYPFAPVKQEFLTFVYGAKYINYNQGIETTIFKIKKDKKLEDAHNIQLFKQIADWFTVKKVLAGQIKDGTTTLGYCNNIEELKNFQLISGESYYVGREGIEFYPQELFLLNIVSDMKPLGNNVYVKNYQSGRSKHKVTERIIPIEKDFLHPLVKGRDIERFHWSGYNYVVPFPYENFSKIPIPIKKLHEIAPNLAKFLLNNKTVIEKQTEYNERIINNKLAEFYALARVGEYTYAEYSVGYRDNTKWQAVVIGPTNTEWSNFVRPLYQNHAVSITQDVYGNLISEDEAHYICAILNSKIVTSYMMNSSDSRSFKIRIPVKIPKYDPTDNKHTKLSELSKLAHRKHNDKDVMKTIDEEINSLYLEICSKQK